MLISKTNIPDIGFVTIKKFINSKSIKISINSKRGILISTPLFCPEKKAIDFCLSKKEWILKQLEKINSNKNNFIFTPDSIFKTRNFEIKFSVSNKKNFYAKIENNIIVFYYNSETNFYNIDIQGFIKKFISNVLKFEAENYIIPRFKEIANQYNIKFRSIKINTAKTRWGSCSQYNDIKVSASLMLLPDELIDYVIFHELCHVFHKNHSEKFHELLNRFLNGREKELNKKIKCYNSEIIPGDFSYKQ